MPSQEINIREVTNSDLERIFQFTLQLHHHEDDKKIATGKDFETNLRKWLELEISNSQSLYLIAEIKNKDSSSSSNTASTLAGFIGATSVINDNGFLENPLKGVVQLLWIEKKFRSKNIAAKLLNCVEECFKNIGITYIECTYTNENDLAENFWRKQKFKKHSITARKIL